MPRWGIEKKQRKATKYFNQYFYPWLGEKLDTVVMSCLADDLVIDFGYRLPCQRLAVIDTFVAYQGKVLTKELAVLLSLQLVWNSDALERGRALTKFTAVPQRTWLPFIIKNISSIERFGQQLAQLHLTCIGGFAAGYQVQKSVPWNFLRYFAYQVGYTRRRPYDEPAQLLQLRFAGLIEPSDSDELDFTHYKLNAGMKRSNKLLVHERSASTEEEEF